MTGDEIPCARLLKHVSPEPNSGCWLWTGRTNQDGYGIFWIKDCASGKARHLLAHRAAYRSLVGEIPGAFVLDHKCRVRSCVNPDHLDPVTQAENIRRGETGLWNATKTHCPRGHAYGPPKRVPSGRQQRDCKECHTMLQRERRAARRTIMCEAVHAAF